MADSELPDDPQAYLQAGRFVDSDHPAVVSYARKAAGDAATARERAVRLFYAVRDDLRYDPYSFTPNADDYRASYILKQPRGFCVTKAVLLAAVARAEGIPARLGFADVKNHLTSDKLRRVMGTDVFAFHGYAELFLDGKWVKATPAFNVELCDRFGVKPLEFDGTSDSLFHEFSQDGRRHMEYIRDRGIHMDLPFEAMLTAMKETYAGRAQPAEVQHDEAFHGDEG